jgi:predicted nuclease with TOPRIM domain
MLSPQQYDELFAHRLARAKARAVKYDITLDQVLAIERNGYLDDLTDVDDTLTTLTQELSSFRDDLTSEVSNLEDALKRLSGEVSSFKDSLSASIDLVLTQGAST